jgi:hypothetical protein
LVTAARPVAARRDLYAGSRWRVRHGEGGPTVGEPGLGPGALLDRGDEVVELGAVGGAIPFQEEVEVWAGRLGPVGTVEPHAGRELVGGGEHPVLAERLQPLVVPEGAVPAVGDLAQRPTRPAEHHHGGVDVADRADVVGHQVRAHRLDLDDVPEKVPGQVEVVDGHVAEQPAGHREVLDRRRGRVAAGDDELFQPADLAGAYPIPDLLERRVEPPVEPDHHGRIGVCDLLPARVHPRDVQVDRLLAEHRLAGEHRTGEQVDVGRGG